MHAYTTALDRYTHIYIYMYIYTYSDSHINYTFTRVFIRTQTYIHLQGCILYAYVHTHIYIYIYITGANVTPRHGWTCIGAAAACKCRQYELPDCGGRVLKSYIYIYIYMDVSENGISNVNGLFLGFSNNSLEGIYQAHVQTCPYIYI